MLILRKELVKDVGFLMDGMLSFIKLIAFATGKTERNFALVKQIARCFNCIKIYLIFYKAVG